jgi:rod shape determining protein RodA
MSQDFIRRLPQSSGAFTRARSIGEMIHIDLFLVLVITVIVVFGLVVLYSAVEQQREVFTNQLTRIGIAVVVMVFLAQFPPHIYLRVAPWFYAGVILSLLLIYPFGFEVNGSRRWLRIPGLLGFQPSELMKLALPLMLAWYLNDRHLPPGGKQIGFCLLMIVIPTLLIYDQPDLGTAVIIASSGFLVLLLAGISWRLVAAAGVAVLSMAPLLWFTFRDYQRRRILTFFDPEHDPLGAGWNIIQSTTAIGSGGWAGKGLFKGTQSHLDFLPESATDFIIAVLAEEFGFIGVMVLLILYGFLTLRGILISLNAQDTFGRLVSGTVTFTFFIYVFVNIGMVSGIVPVVGVPLPLISYGGTSLLTLFAGFGLLMSIHTHRRITL